MAFSKVCLLRFIEYINCIITLLLEYIKRYIQGHLLLFSMSVVLLVYGYIEENGLWISERKKDYLTTKTKLVGNISLF